MAYKVFLVEDESVIREGLRDNIPWQQYGFTLVGEAGDGEMALPLIRKERPDVLITDIKMPFMDGLSLTHIVKQEFPEMKIIIISGYDDFEYAQKAIKEGVEQYLLKPVTRSMLQKALEEIKEKLSAQEEQKQYMRKFQDEMQEYEQSFRRNFFEKVFEGQTPLQDIYEEAGRHSLDINANAYNLILMCVQEKKGINSSALSCQECQEELMRFFLRFSRRCITFRWSINIYGILIKGETDDIKAVSDGYLNDIEEICKKYAKELNWYAAAGNPVERFSLLGECYQSANHAFSYRFFTKESNILRADDVQAQIDRVTPASDKMAIEEIDSNLVNPETIKRFLSDGQRGEVTEFVANYIGGLESALASRLFWDYLLLNLRFTVTAYIQAAGIDSEEFLQTLDLERARTLEMTADNMKSYMQELLDRAIEYRDRSKDSQGKKALKKAIAYIEESFADENISLNEVAAVSQMSPNYLSAVFSQEMGKTFVEYVTEKRMQKAKELLLTDGIRSTEVGPMVGYKNPQYFSFVFKKTEGCSPREYRAANKQQ